MFFKSQFLNISYNFRFIQDILNNFEIKWLYAAPVCLPFTCRYDSICILGMIMIIDHVYNVYIYSIYKAFIKHSLKQIPS